MKEATLTNYHVLIPYDYPRKNATFVLNISITLSGLLFSRSS